MVYTKELMCVLWFLCRLLLPPVDVVWFLHLFGCFLVYLHLPSTSAANSLIVPALPDLHMFRVSSCYMQG
jgi:hypothetical protein